MSSNITAISELKLPKLSHSSRFFYFHPVEQVTGEGRVEGSYEGKIDPGLKFSALKLIRIDNHVTQLSSFLEF